MWRAVVEATSVRHPPREIPARVLWWHARFINAPSAARLVVEGAASDVEGAPKSSLCSTCPFVGIALVSPLQSS